MRKWGWRLISRIGALLLLGFFLLVISLPNLIDLENFRPQLLQYLQSRIVGEVVVGKLKLTFQHGPGVRVDGIKIVDKSGLQHISVTTAIVNFDLGRLFQRHIHPCRVTLVQPRISLQLDTGSSLLAGFMQPVLITASDAKRESSNSFSDKRESAGFLESWYFDTNISEALVEIIDGSVEFTDCCFGFSPVLTHLEGLNSLLKWQKSGAPAEFVMTARVVDEHGDGSLKIEGSLSSLQWPLRPGEMVLDCQVDAENLNAATYFPYYQEYVPMRFVGARVDIDSTYRGSLMGLFRSQGRIVLHQAELDYQQVFSQKLKFDRFAVDYDFRLADRYNTIETLRCAIDADGLKLKGHCLLYEARRGIDGTIEAGLEISEFDPLSVSHLLPWKIMPEKIRSYYQLLQPGGCCVVENAFLKGDYRKIVRLAEKKPPIGVLGGQLKVNNLLFNISKEWPSFAVGAAAVDFESDTLRFSDLDFDWDGLSGYVVNLSLQKLFHDPQIEGSGNFDFDLKRLQPLLEKFFQDSSENTLPAISYGGLLQGELALKGPLVRLAEISWGGIVRGRDLSFTMPKQSLTISQGEASFILAKDQIVVENASCNFASMPFKLQAVLPGPKVWFGSNMGCDYSFEFTAQTPDVSPENLNILFGSKASVSGKRTGASPFELHLNGDLKNLSDLQWQGKLNLDWGDVGLPFIAGSLERFNCLAEFSREKIDFERLYLEHGESDLLFQGELAWDGEGLAYVVNGEVVADLFLVDDFLALLGIGKFSDENIVSAEATEGVNSARNRFAWGETGVLESASLKVDLDGVFKELVLPSGDGFENLGTPRSPWRHFKDFTFSCRGGSKALLTINECSWGWGEQEAQVTVSGELQYNGEGLDGALDIAIQELDFDALLNSYGHVQAKEEEGDTDLNPQTDRNVEIVLFEELAGVDKASGVEKLLSWKDLLVRNNLHVRARAQHLYWQQMMLDEIECDCTFDGLGVKFNEISGHSFGGGLNALAQWRYVDDYFAVEAELIEINFETFNEYLKNPDRGLPMQGGYGSLNLDLGWQGGSLKNWIQSLDGQLDFDFHEGRMKKFTLLANVCSLLNLSQFAALRLPKISVGQGVPYQTLSGQGTIVDGVLEIDDFAMRGSSLNLLSDGEISFVDEQIDLKIGVQPLQTIDKLLATIPVVGYIITGDKKTFVVIPITVTGPFDDVQIKTQTVSGLGQKVGSMIQRFFKTPVRLLQMPGKLLNQIGDLETDAGVENK